MLMCAAFLAGRGAVSGMFLFLFYFYLAVVCGVWLRVSKAVARFRECTARVLVPSLVHTHTHTHTHTHPPLSTWWLHLCWVGFALDVYVRCPTLISIGGATGPAV